MYHSESMGLCLAANHMENMGLCLFILMKRIFIRVNFNKHLRSKLGKNFNFSKFLHFEATNIFLSQVTPCIPRCDPVNCDVTDFHGDSQRLSSFGRRKRRSPSGEHHTKYWRIFRVVLGKGRRDYRSRLNLDLPVR